MNNKIFMLDVGFDQNGLTKIWIENEGVFYVDYNLNKVSEVISSGKWIGNKYYAIETVGGKAGYFEFDGQELKRKTEDLGRVFRFQNGISLVKETNEDGLPFRAYYMNQEFNVVSPIYKDANLFNDEGCAVVVGLDDKSHMINEKFVQISPSFDHIYEPDSNGVLIAKTRYRNQDRYSYYQYNGEIFECVSPEYKSVTYFRNEVAVVQDIESGKYYAVDQEFKRVSKIYDEMVGIYGNPGIIIAKQDGKKTLLTTETMSEIKNADRYWKMFKRLNDNGYSPMLESLGDFFNADDIENENFMQDLKVALKDYLIHNVYRMGYDDVSNSYYVKFSKEGKFDNRIDPEKMYRWIEKVVKEAPDRAEELYMLSQGKILG